MPGGVVAQHTHTEETAISVAGTDFIGTNSVAIFTGVASPGSRCRTITINAAGDTTQGCIRLYRKNAGGKKFFMQIPVQERKTSVNVPPWTSGPITIHPDIGSCESAAITIEAAPYNAETFHVIAGGFDFV